MIPPQRRLWLVCPAPGQHVQHLTKGAFMRKFIVFGFLTLLCATAQGGVRYSAHNPDSCSTPMPDGNTSMDRVMMWMQDIEDTSISGIERATSVRRFQRVCGSDGRVGVRRGTLSTRPSTSAQLPTATSFTSPRARRKFQCRRRFDADVGYYIVFCGTGFAGTITFADTDATVAIGAANVTLSAAASSRVSAKCDGYQR